MKLLMKTVVLSCAVWMSASAIHGGTASASTPSADRSVKIQLNDQLIPFPEAQPYIDDKGQTFVPIRPVLESLGYQMDWEMENGQVDVTVKGDKQKTVELTTGANEAKLNGKAVPLTSGALFRDGTVFVPVRFISESLGIMIQWDNDNRIAILCQDGQYHAPAWYAPPVVQALAAAPAPSVVDRITDTAQNMLGIRYVWGGTTPSGFDCSGFVNYVFDQFGVDLPRTSRDMFHNSGQPVTELKKGDLVFFNIGRVTTHVGIYLGNDQFVSATTSRGTQIDSLTSSYWGPKYVGAKRIL
ncbi:NlpC/P60 family protein [Paenibacillus sp. GCM10012303]|uniref:C40 family peptidase n=1 Tax=Paenibacillus sp. GCM10012303 TaxID=3317340 RepID=UPI00361DCB9F